MKRVLKIIWPLLIIGIGGGYAFYVVNGHKPNDTTITEGIGAEASASPKETSTKNYAEVKKSWSDKHITFEPGTSVFANDKDAQEVIKKAAEFGAKYIKIQIQLTASTDGTEAAKPLAEKRVTKISEALTEAGAKHVKVLANANFQDAVKAAKTPTAKTDAAKKADHVDITIADYNP